MKRTLNALAGLSLLLAGCTGSPGPSPTLLFDQPDPEVVHVKLVITAHVQTSVQYSNGDMSMFAMCAATQVKPADPEEGNDGAPMVGFYSESKKDVWAGWATRRYTDSHTEIGLAFGSNEAAGPVRLVVVPLQRIDPATCSITISGQEKAADQATGLGDIATCSASVD